MNEEATQDVRQQISMSIAEAESFVKRAEALERLLNNPDFKEVVTDHYCGSFCTKLVSLLGDESVFSNPEQYARINEQIKSVAWFQNYLRNVKGMGRQMKEQIALARKEEHALDAEEAQGNA